MTRFIPYIAKKLFMDDQNVIKRRRLIIILTNFK